MTTDPKMSQAEAVVRNGRVENDVRGLLFALLAIAGLGVGLALVILFLLQLDDAWRKIF